MSELSRLYRQANIHFWQYPRLWLYSVGAELARYGFSLVAGLLQQAAKHLLLPTSVFGGYAGAGSELELKAATVVAIIGGIANALGLLAYVIALGFTARQISKLQQDGVVPLRGDIPRGIQACFLSLAGCLALAVVLAWGVLSVVPGSNLTVALATACLPFLAALYLAVPALQRYIRANQAHEGFHSRGVDYLLVAQAVFLNLALGFAFKSVALRDTHIAALLARPFWSFAILVPFALLGALPYAWSIIALSLDPLERPQIKRDE